MHMYEFLIILSYFWKFLTFAILILHGFFFNTDEVSLANEDGLGKSNRLSEGDYNMDSSSMICHTFKVSHYLEVLLTPLVWNTCRFPGPFTYTVLIWRQENVRSGISIKSENSPPPTGFPLLLMALVLTFSWRIK